MSAPQPGATGDGGPTRETARQVRTPRLAVAVCGTALDRTAQVLDLDRGGSPRLVLVDLRDPDAAAAAGAFPPDLPRVAVVTEEQRELLTAAGSAVATATSTDPAVLGPLIAAVLPRTGRGATRVIVVTAGRGGVGRTLLVSNLAHRLAAGRSVLAMDLTASGALGWWLGATGRPWLEVAPLTAELQAEHLAVLAVEVAPRLSLVGGPPRMPAADLASAAIAAARDLVDMVIVDAPPAADPVSRAAIDAADRVLALSYDDPVSRAIREAAALPDTVWWIGAQGPIDDPFRVLPRDERAVAEAAATRRAVRGQLGTAYDELAEVLAIDAS
ncbi:MAG TPA: ParA family protein [Candidatus Saccharimonadales bacterium]|nr:ParA family protein [Candidatus Saccharimonadales bacterium]